MNKSLKFHHLLIAVLLIFLLAPGCGKDDFVPVTEPTNNPKDTIPNPPVDTVEVLDPSKVDVSKIYIPQEFRNMDMFKSSSQWYYGRSRQSEHFIVFWGAGYGKNDPNASAVPSAYRVDIDDLLNKAEGFYQLNVEQLKFAEKGVGKSNLDNYKMMIFILYQTDWLATGAGYDDVIGALWVSPSTCHPVGSTIAHEIGHSFQYQVNCDLKGGAGFRYGFGGNGGNAFWEQTAQWQSFQSYPNEVFGPTHTPIYLENCHRHFNHEHYRYASYMLHYYWTQKHGKEIVGQIWRGANKPEDPFQAYMRLTGIDVATLNDELFDAASHFVTWDIDGIRQQGQAYVGAHSWKYNKTDDGFYQVAYDKCPGTTGYNVIELKLPSSGSKVSADFVGQTNASGFNQVADIKREGWRYGFVALLKDGSRQYGEANKGTSKTVEFEVPANTERIWFVVTGAPNTYTPHAWDENNDNDDQWPYKVKFANTDLIGNVTIDPASMPQDLALTYEVSFPADGANYSGTTVRLNSNGDISKVAQALVMQPTALAGAFLAPKASPQNGKVAFAAVGPGGALNYNTTANGLGFWFDGSGAVIGWGSDNDSKVFAEFTSSNFEFSIGQFPGKSKAGDKYTIKEAFVYQLDGKTYQVTFTFNITIT